MNNRPTSSRKPGANGLWEFVVGDHEHWSSGSGQRGDTSCVVDSELTRPRNHDERFTDWDLRIQLFCGHNCGTEPSLTLSDTSGFEEQVVGICAWCDSLKGRSGRRALSTRCGGITAPVGNRTTRRPTPEFRVLVHHRCDNGAAGLAEVLPGRGCVGATDRAIHPEPISYYTDVALPIDGQAINRVEDRNVATGALSSASQSVEYTVTLPLVLLSAGVHGELAT